MGTFFSSIYFVTQLLVSFWKFSEAIRLGFLGL